MVSGAGVPDPPRTPLLHAKSPHIANVTWDEPVNNGATITEYRLEWQQRADAEFAQVPWQHILQDNHRARESAVSQKVSRWFVPSAVLRSCDELRGARTDACDVVQLQGAGTQQCRGRFVAPLFSFSPSGRLFRQTVLFLLSSRVLVIVRSVLEVNFAPLFIVFAYSFSTNHESFAGPFSAIASCATPPSSPSAVVSLKATSTANSVSLTWKEPPNNGSDILCYNIDLGEKHLISVGNVLEYTIDDLLPETTYK